MPKFLVTGGSGFIGSNLINEILSYDENSVCNIDCHTYASVPLTEFRLSKNLRYRNYPVDILDRRQVQNIILDFKPNVLIHLAAESHVDRSIENPIAFLQTNIMGTHSVLSAALEWMQRTKEKFLFHHVSTDEVFGSLSKHDPAFTASTAYAPNSPYSSSKAGSDFLVRAWNKTYGLPVVISNCSNNYGPYQYPEKLIPISILRALSGKNIEIYGNGSNIRDWIYVEDHARALYKIATEGKVGSVYLVGGQQEVSNTYIVNSICDILDRLVPKKSSYRELVTYVTDRPGHDFRYAIDSSSVEQLGWCPRENLDTGLIKTVEWYLCNVDWWQSALDAKGPLSRIGLHNPKFIKEL